MKLGRAMPTGQLIASIPCKPRIVLCFEQLCRTLDPHLSSYTPSDNNVMIVVLSFLSCFCLPLPFLSLFLLFFPSIACYCPSR